MKKKKVVLSRRRNERRKRGKKGEIVRLENHPRIAICFNKQATQRVCDVTGSADPCNKNDQFLTAK